MNAETTQHPPSSDLFDQNPPPSKEELLRRNQRSSSTQILKQVQDDGFVFVLGELKKNLSFRTDVRNLAIVIKTQSLDFSVDKLLRNDKNQELNRSKRSYFHTIKLAEFSFHFSGNGDHGGIICAVGNFWDMK